jgi:hypothetical protein
MLILECLKSVFKLFNLISKFGELTAVLVPLFFLNNFFLFPLEDIQSLNFLKNLFDVQLFLFGSLIQSNQVLWSIFIFSILLLQILELILIILEHNLSVLQFFLQLLLSLGFISNHATILLIFHLLLLDGLLKLFYISR